MQDNKLMVDLINLAINLGYINNKWSIQCTIMKKQKNLILVAILIF